MYASVVRAVATSRRKTLVLTAVFVFLVGLTYYFEMGIPQWRRQREIQRAMMGGDSDEEGVERIVVMDEGRGGKVAAIVNTKQDKEAQLESEAYFDADLQQDKSHNYGNSHERNLTWPTRWDDYTPLSKGTTARTVFNDEGNTLLPVDEEYVSPGPRSLTDKERSSGVHIVTTFFHGSYENRRFSEVVASLIANLENPYVDFVHTIWEKEDPTQHIEKNAPHLVSKLVAVEAKNQPTYAKLFKYVNENLARGSVAIVTNADIYFDSSLRCLQGPDPNSNASAIPNSERSVFALSRRHTTLCGKAKADHGSVLDLCQDYVHSHDAFVFAPPVPPVIIKKTNHMQNRYGGENIVVWEFTLIGYKVMNPCKKLHAIHLHCSAERQYVTRFIDGLYGNGPYRHGTVWPGTIRTGSSKKDWKPAPLYACGAPIL